MMHILTKHGLRLINFLTKHRSRTTLTYNGYKFVVAQNLYVGKMFYCEEGKQMNPNDKMKVMLGEIKNEDKESLQELEKYDNNSWKTVRNSLIFLGVSFTVIGSYLLYEFGHTKYNQHGEELIDEYSNTQPVIRYLLRTWKQFKVYQKLITEPSREKLLPDVLTDPYYQPPYTLVMEFTDVIVHPDWTYATGWRFKKRPGFEQFLESLHGLYEIVIYTAEMGMTVFPIMEALDTKNIISYKLVRDATHFKNGKHLKDLDRLNRDLTKVVVIDWNKKGTKSHANNVLAIPRWDGTDDDTSLIDLSNFLRVIAYSDIDDVREVLKYYSQFEDPLKTFRSKQKQLAEMDIMTNKNVNFYN